MIEDRDLRAELRDLHAAAGIDAFRWLAHETGRRLRTIRDWSENRVIGKAERPALASGLSRARKHFYLEDDAPRTNGAANHSNGTIGNANGHAEMPFDAGEVAAAAKAAAAPRMKWETTADILRSPPREYLVDGLLARGEMSLWVGAAKVGKTHLLLHIAHLLAVGAPTILGRSARRAMGLYVTAEGGPGLIARVRALEKLYGVAVDLLIHRRSFDLRREGGDVAEIIAKAKGVGAAFIVIDTVNRALAGGEENSSKDIGQFVRNVDLIREETGAHVAAIHHPPQDRSSPRGHSSLPAASDLVISVCADAKSGLRRAMVVEARDIREGAVFPYRLIEVECEADENGPAITGSTVEILPEEEADRSSVGRRGHPRSAQPDSGAPPPRNTDASRTMVLLRERIAASGKPVPDGVGAPPSTIGIPEDDFRTDYKAGRRDATGNAARQAYNRAIGALEASHGVRRGNGWLWIDPSVTA